MTLVASGLDARGRSEGVTIKFRCYALASNRNQLDPELARRCGIDGFVEVPTGLLLDIEHVATADLRSHIGRALAQCIDDARRFGSQQVSLTLGNRPTWTSEDLIAVDLGLLDGATAMPAHPIDRAYPPANVR